MSLSLRPHRWMSAYMQWALHTVWLPQPLRQQEEADAAMHSLQRPALALKDREWLVGSKFTVADLNVASVINLLQGKVGGCAPAVASWLDRCLGRAAYLRAIGAP